MKLKLMMLSGAIALTSVAGMILAASKFTQAGVVIPSGPEHRQLHSVVVFKGGEKAGAWIKLDIEALQDGDFIQYIAAISTDCDDKENKDDSGKSKKPECPQIAQEVNYYFTQNIKNHSIQQLVDLDLTGTVFLAGILKRQ